MNWEDFKEIWITDFEFLSPPGETPSPLCVVAKEILSGKLTRRLWLDNPTGIAPYSTCQDALFVAYYASAEMGCHLALGWERPANILDLYAEYRNYTNGIEVSGNSLLGAAAHFGVDGGDAAYKDSMRERILQGPPYMNEEKDKILTYCEKDVDLTSKLFLKMKEHIDLPRALLRGRYMWSVACMERTGVPLDIPTLQVLRAKWDPIKTTLIKKIDAGYNVYDGNVFKIHKFKEYLLKNNIAWEMTPSGQPRLDDEFLKEQSKVHPELQPLRELRYALGQLRLNALQVGKDGRNRAMLSPYRSKTGRNQPSSSRFIFGNAIWLRHLIKPEPGKALAYVDYEQQEFGIAAALSRDKNMLDAYNSGDPYITFAKQARVVPQDGTKATHPREREIFKTCTIALNYGMSPESFAKRINVTPIEARGLFRMHRETYAKYWDWSERSTDTAKLTGKISTVFGWVLQASRQQHRTLQNFPMQATGAEILRVAACMLIESGISVCAPIHDAILIESRQEEIDRTVIETQRLMADASEIVLGDLRLRTDAKIVRYPEAYTDPRGAVMWQRILEVVNETP